MPSEPSTPGSRHASVILLVAIHAALMGFAHMRPSAAAAPPPSDHDSSSPQKRLPLPNPLLRPGQAAEPLETPFAGCAELSVDALVAQVLARNPSLGQMVAAWEAASTRYPQVTSLDDPTFTGTVGPGSIGSNDVDFAYRLEVSQKYPFPGKRRLRASESIHDRPAIST